MSSMNQYMKKQNIRYALQNKIRSYIEYQMKDNQQNDSDVQFGCDLLSESLKNQLQEEARQPVLKQLKWIEQFSNEFKHNLILMFEEIKYSPGDYILKQDEIDDSSLYILQDGIVDIKFSNLVLQQLSADSTDNYQYNSIGSTFGEFGFFTTQARTCSVVSNGYSKLLKLKHADLINTLTKQSDIETLFQIRQSIEQNDFGPCNLKCYSCGKNHLIKNCPNHHLVLDKETIIKKNEFPVQQEREKYIRKLHKFGTNTLSSLYTIQKQAQNYLVSASISESLQDNITQQQHEPAETQISQTLWLPLTQKQEDYSDQTQLVQLSPIKLAKRCIQRNSIAETPINGTESMHNYANSPQFNVKAVLEQYKQNKKTQGNSIISKNYSPYTFIANAIKIINIHKLAET